MEHRGEILKKLLSQLGIKHKAVAEKIGVHPNTMANHLDRAELDDDLLLKIGAALNHDMAESFPSLRRAQAKQQPELPADYPTSTEVPNTLPDCQRALMALQAKHIAFMHDYIDLLRQTTQISIGVAA